MFGSDKNVHKESGITLIASNCELAGDVVFNDELQINGLVEGNIIAKGGSKALDRVSKSGIVKGEIRAPNVVINGQIFGDVHSSNHIELAANAQIKGNVYYNLIEMVMGSRIDGGLIHRTENTKSGKKSNLKVEEEPKPRVAAVRNTGTVASSSVS